MFYKLLNILDKKISFVTVSAKSSCSNYDPISMQLAALTLIRNSDLISEFQSKRFLTLVEQNKYNDLLSLKLESCMKIKRELVLLLKHFNNELPSEQSLNVDLLMTEAFIDIEMNSYQIDRKISKHLLSLANKLVEMYWNSKGVKTIFSQCSAPINHALCIRC